MTDEWELISEYSRRQAIEDGVLVDMTQDPFGAMAKEAGVKWPIAMTATAFHQYVELTEAAKQAGNDIKGRWWDVVWMYRCAVAKSRGQSHELMFQFYCVTDNPSRPELVTLKAVAGPDDNRRPCLTFMLPDED